MRIKPQIKISGTLDAMLKSNKPVKAKNRFSDLKVKSKEFQIEKDKNHASMPTEVIDEMNSESFSQIRLDSAYENSVIERRSVSFTPTAEDREHVLPKKGK